MLGFDQVMLAERRVDPMIASTMKSSRQVQIINGSTAMIGKAQLLLGQTPMVKTMHHGC
ncbi:MAG: hypothetical protein AAGF11_19935 [Myxococcota bacterium]